MTIPLVLGEQDVLSALQVKALRQPKPGDYMLLVLHCVSSMEHNKLGFRAELEEAESLDLYWNKSLLHCGNNWKPLDHPNSLQGEYQNHGEIPEEYLTTVVWTIPHHGLKCMLSITLVKETTHLFACEALLYNL